MNPRHQNTPLPENRPNQNPEGPGTVGADPDDVGSGTRDEQLPTTPFDDAAPPNEAERPGRSTPVRADLRDTVANEPRTDDGGSGLSRAFRSLVRLFTGPR